MPSQWYPEVNHFCKGVPVLLVGCKTDLRQDQEVLQKLKDGRMEPVSRQQVSVTSRWDGMGRGCPSARGQRGPGWV